MTNESAGYISSDKGRAGKTMALNFWFNQLSPCDVFERMIKEINQVGSDERGERGKCLILPCRLIRMKYTRCNKEASVHGARVQANTAEEERLKQASRRFCYSDPGRAGLMRERHSVICGVLIYLLRAAHLLQKWQCLLIDFTLRDQSASTPQQAKFTVKVQTHARTHPVWKQIKIS